MVIPLLESYSKSNPLDIIFGTETWLHSEILNSELNLSEYDIHRRDRTGKKGGGIILCVKKSLNSIFLKKGSKSECIFVKLVVPKKPPIILGCAYRAPDLSLDQCEDLVNEISEIKNKYNKSHFWLAGDFNLPSIDWETNSIKKTKQKKKKQKNYQYSLSVNNLFLEMSQTLGLKQIVSEPTRGKNILDLFFTNNTELIDKTEIVSGVSDHEAVIINSRLRLRHQKQPRRKILLWNRADTPKIKAAAKEFRQNFLDKYPVDDANSDVNEMWSCIQSNLLTILENNVPSKLSSSKSLPPWINNETKRLIRNKKLWYKKAKTRNNSESWKIYSEYKRETQKQCRIDHDAYVQDLIAEDKTNKKFWSYIKSQRNEKTGIADIFDNDTWVTDPKQKANLFNEQFCKVFSKPDQLFTPPAPSDNTDNPQITNIIVSKDCFA